jgi:serine/threonine-protein kinase
VKPDNILLEEATGRALVADFGIAAELQGAGRDGADVMGTPEFMSPEQALGEPADARGDLYALGAVGYFALTGKVPFEGPNATAVLTKVVTEPAPPVASMAAVPRRLAEAIDTCLAKDPAERPQTGEALAEQLGVAIGQRRELPVALQVFVRRGGRLSGVGWLVYVCLVPVAVGFVGRQFGRDAAIALLVGALTVVPVGVLVTRARRLLAAGFGLEDVREAFRVEMERGREERSVEFGRGPSVGEWVLRALCVGGLAAGAVAGIQLLTATYPAMTFTRWQALFQVFRWCSLGGVLSGFLVVERIQRRVDLDTRVWSWCWGGTVGRFLVRVARVLAPERVLASPTHRATELALAVAAEQLFLDLPRELQSQLGGLPDVVHRLEEDARRMRRRLDQLQDVLGDGPKGVDARDERVVLDLEEERSAVSRRHADVVKALATLRLNLLRLNAGSGSVQGLTTELGRAREVADEIYRQIAVREEIDNAML